MNREDVLRIIKPELVIKAVFRGIVHGDASIFNQYDILEWRASSLKYIYDLCPVRFHAPTYTWRLDKTRRKSVLAKLDLVMHDQSQLQKFADKLSKLIPYSIYRRPYSNPIIDVHLQNGIIPQNVFGALSDPTRYYVYAHTYGNNMYIGRSNDLVNRWFTHYDAAFNPFHPDYKYPFKVIIREHYKNIKHHLLYVTNDSKKVEEYEALAIEYYKPNLNTKIERSKFGSKFVFDDLDLNAPIIPMSRNSREWTYSNKVPIMGVARFDSRRGYIRIYCDKGQQFPEGTLITCSKSQRAHLSDEQKVIINVCWQATGKCLNGLHEDIIPL